MDGERAPEEAQQGETSGPSRRGFLSTAAMFAGLALSHVVAFGFGARYIYPSSTARRRKLYVAQESEVPVGSSLPFRSPTGQTINVVHTRNGFVALSDVCPHLGCRVHWDAVGREFVCPCHDGHFDATGAPVSGPPKDMNTPLERYDIVIEQGTIFLDVVVYG